MEMQITGLSKRYGRQCVLNQASLFAASGQIVGILGANGSGKSTLLSILAGIQKPDSGSFALDGRELFGAPKLRSRMVGYVPQGTPLIPELTARDNLLLWYSPKALKAELESGVLKLLDIGPFLNKRVSTLSGGMKKRLSIGCAVHGRPPVLLLDEPTAALDLAGRRDIARYLQAYRSAGGIGLLTTHCESELALCDRLYLLKDGTLQSYDYDGDLNRLVESL